MAFVTVDDLRIHYQAVGQGPDVLLIHGWLSSWRMWARSMSRLAAAASASVAMRLMSSIGILSSVYSSLVTWHLSRLEGGVTPLLPPRARQGSRRL